MTIYYTSSDIEELVSSGISRLELGEGVMITDVARELAQELGIELVAPGMVLPTAGTPAAAPAAAPRVSSRWNKPSGCQHGPLPAQSGGANQQRGGAVSELVNIVSQLTNRR